MSYTSEDYKNYILDQLRQAEEVSARKMFSGYGLYMQGKFFGIISGDQLYFKTNEKTRVKYIKFGSKPFRPSPKQKLKNYYEVPSEIIENPEKLKSWAESCPR